ncbi:hypothetical protein BDY24DRAFT_400298 [Mrakia frigida]|uniref:SET domain-containing protein n=1 Tax=Mrakia frigida TaxID=29902 RepID=UPI003FCC0737
MSDLIPTTVPPHPFIRVEPIPNKGLGTIATKFIPKGTLVIEETPLFVFDAPLAAFIFSRQVDIAPLGEDTSFSALDNHLGRLVDALMEPKSDEEKRVLFELANTHPELPLGYGVFKTNAICTVLTQGGLFPLLSRVNSSCRPNLSRPLWFKDEKLIRLWTLRDIEEGEELDWMYLDSFSRTTEERLGDTFRVLGFPCSCPLCTSPSSLTALSDTRVLRLKHLTSLLPSTDFDTPLSTTESPEELKLEAEIIEEMLGLAREEKLWDLEKSLLRREEVVRKVRKGPRGMVVAGEEEREVRRGRVCACCV